MVTKGTTSVRATDARNSLHYDESEVSSCHGDVVVTMVTGTCDISRYYVILT